MTTSKYGYPSINSAVVAAKITAFIIVLFGSVFALGFVGVAIGLFLTPWLLLAYVPLALFAFVYVIIKGFDLTTRF
jgi:hypothetical protein